MKLPDEFFLIFFIQEGDTGVKEQTVSLFLFNVSPDIIFQPFIANEKIYHDTDSVITQ